ncbi:MAG: hypothetical protein ACJ0H0_02470 [Vicinamibacterales bacterium]
MKSKTLITLLVVSVSSMVILAQSAPNAISMVTLVGCVVEGTADGLFIEKATIPQEIHDRLPEQPASDVPLGGGRVRLIGTLGEFGVGAHIEHKVWVKGLYIAGESENRLNLISITHLAETCQ